MELDLEIEESSKLRSDGLTRISFLIHMDDFKNECGCFNMDIAREDAGEKLKKKFIDFLKKFEIKK